MRKFFIVAVAASLLGAPALAREPLSRNLEPIKPCMVVQPKTEKELKRAIREMRARGFRIEVTRGAEKKVVSEGGDPFPFALAQANVPVSGCP